MNFTNNNMTKANACINKFLENLYIFNDNNN